MGLRRGRPPEALVSCLVVSCILIDAFRDRRADISGGENLHPGVRYTSANSMKGAAHRMAAEVSGVVPTRLADLSGLSLGDVARQDPDAVARISEPLIREVTAQAQVSLAGSNS